MASRRGCDGPVGMFQHRDAESADQAGEAVSWALRRDQDSESAFRRRPLSAVARSGRHPNDQLPRSMVRECGSGAFGPSLNEETDQTMLGRLYVGEQRLREAQARSATGRSSKASPPAVSSECGGGAGGQTQGPDDDDDDGLGGNLFSPGNSGSRPWVAPPNKGGWITAEQAEKLRQEVRRIADRGKQRSRERERDENYLSPTL